MHNIPLHGAQQETRQAITSDGCPSVTYRPHVSMASDAMSLSEPVYHSAVMHYTSASGITQVKACSRETHSPSWASKTYGHNAFQIIHIHTTVFNSGRAHTTQHRTHCGL